jgi:hypothetical protein
MLNEQLRESLEKGLALVESAFSHVSHGGPTRADAEKWIGEARAALASKQEAPAAAEDDLRDALELIASERWGYSECVRIAKSALAAAPLEKDTK